MIKINFITAWAQGIIVAVIIATIIEMILPDGNNSKYIKMVIGVFVLFTIVSPVVNKMTGNKNKLDLNSYIENNSKEAVITSASVDNEKLIKQMYEENLKVDIKAKISQRGYVVGDLNVGILDNNEYTLDSINMKIVGNNQNSQNNKSAKTTTIVENVENIIVNISGKSPNEKEEEKSVITESERRRLVQYLSGVYEVKESNIVIR